MNPLDLRKKFVLDLRPLPSRSQADLGNLGGWASEAAVCALCFAVLFAIIIILTN